MTSLFVANDDRLRDQALCVERSGYFGLAAAKTSAGAPCRIWRRAGRSRRSCSWARGRSREHLRQRRRREHGDLGRAPTLATAGNASEAETSGERTASALHRSTITEVALTTAGRTLPGLEVELLRRLARDDRDDARRLRRPRSRRGRAGPRPGRTGRRRGSGCERSTRAVRAAEPVDLFGRHHAAVGAVALDLIRPSRSQRRSVSRLMPAPGPPRSPRRAPCRSRQVLVEHGRDLLEVERDGNAGPIGRWSAISECNARCLAWLAASLDAIAAVEEDRSPSRPRRGRRRGTQSRALCRAGRRRSREVKARAGRAMSKSSGVGTACPGAREGARDRGKVLLLVRERAGEVAAAVGAKERRSLGAGVERDAEELGPEHQPVLREIGLCRGCRGPGRARGQRQGAPTAPKRRREPDGERVGMAPIDTPRRYLGARFPPTGKPDRPET